MLSPKTSRFGIVLLALALALVFSAPALAANGPNIVWKAKEIDLGSVNEGQVLEAVFEFFNDGDLNLIISEVSPSCGCTASSFTKVTKPGERGEVVLTLDTQGITGHFRKTAVVSTNDATNSFATLVMTGETKSGIQVDKGRRIRLTGCLGSEIMTTATISDPAGKPILITGLNNPMKDYLEAKLSHNVKSKSYLLTLRSLSTEAVEVAGPLFFDLGDGSKVSIFVVMDVKGPVWVQPREMYLGSISKKAKPVKRYILLRKECVDVLTLDKLVFDPLYLTVKPIWEKEGEKLFLEVTPNLSGVAMGPLKQEIEVIASGNEFKIAVSGVVRD